MTDADHISAFSLDERPGLRKHVLGRGRPVAFSIGLRAFRNLALDLRLFLGRELTGLKYIVEIAAGKGGVFKEPRGKGVGRAEQGDQQRGEASQVVVGRDLADPAGIIPDSVGVRIEGGTDRVLRRSIHVYM